MCRFTCCISRATLQIWMALNAKSYMNISKANRTFLVHPKRLIIRRISPCHYRSRYFLASALVWGELSPSRYGRFTHRCGGGPQSRSGLHGGEKVVDHNETRTSTSRIKWLYWLHHPGSNNIDTWHCYGMRILLHCNTWFTAGYVK
jgi:hypothetical protein